MKRPYGGPRNTNEKRQKRNPRPRVIPRYIRPIRDYLQCTRTTYSENWTPNPNSTNGFYRYYQLNLSNVNNFGEFTALFDQYKINAIVYKFVPRYDGFSGNDTTDTTLPGVTNQGATRMHIMVDPYSVDGPTGAYTSATLNSFLERGSNIKTYDGGKTFTVYFKPTYNNTVEGSNTNRVPSKWLNTTTPTINHLSLIHI